MKEAAHRWKKRGTTLLRSPTWFKSRGSEGKEKIVLCSCTYHRSLQKWRYSERWVHTIAAHIKPHTCVLLLLLLFTFHNSFPSFLTLFILAAALQAYNCRSSNNPRSLRASGLVEQHPWSFPNNGLLLLTRCPWAAGPSTLRQQRS
jgi:hypothetical protein